MRSTARWVLPVLVGPSTATRCDGAAPVDLSLMSRNPAARTARLESRQGLPRIVYAPTAYASGLRDKHRGRRCQRDSQAGGRGARARTSSKSRLCGGDDLRARLLCAFPSPLYLAGELSELGSDRARTVPRSRRRRGGAGGEGGRARRRFQFCIERFQDGRRLFLQLSESKLVDGSSPSARAARRGIALPFTRRRLHLDGALVRELRAEFGGNLAQRFPGSTPIGPNPMCMRSPRATLSLAKRNFACETISFRQVPRKLLKSLGREIFDFEASCDFNDLRPIFFRAFSPSPFFRSARRGEPSPSIGRLCESARK